MKEQEEATDDSRQLLRKHGLRATPARIAVLNLLSQLSQPNTHQEISERLQPSAIDKSTIFRALNDLADAGLARRMELGDHVWRYERLSPSENSAAPQAHPHLLCVDCGGITCLAEDDLTLRVAKWIGTIEDVLLKGRCASCGEDSK